jgi:hypothetical protein
MQGSASDFMDSGSAFRGRGDVYRWLRKNHAAVMDWLEKVEPSWGVIAQRMASEGVVGKKGEAPTRSSARKVWHRVCRDLEAEREREVDRSEAERVREIELLTGVPARKHYPRDFPKDWSPPLSQRSEPAGCSRALVPLSSGAVTTRSEGEADVVSRKEPGEEPDTLALLKEGFEESSYGRKVPLSEIGKRRDQNR